MINDDPIVAMIANPMRKRAHNIPNPAVPSFIANLIVELGVELVPAIIANANC